MVSCRITVTFPGWSIQWPVRKNSYEPTMLMGTMGHVEFLRQAEDAFLEGFMRPSRVREPSGKAARLMPESSAAFAFRFILSRPSRVGTSGTGIFPKRPINQPYTAILKCDSSSKPRTNCGIAE